MNLSDFLRLLTAAVLVSSFVCAHEEEGAVVVLTPVNFDTVEENLPVEDHLKLFIVCGWIQTCVGRILRTLVWPLQEFGAC